MPPVAGSPCLSFFPQTTRDTPTGGCKFSHHMHMTASKNSYDRRVFVCLSQPIRSIETRRLATFPGACLVTARSLEWLTHDVGRLPNGRLGTNKQTKNPCPLSASHAHRT